MTDPTEPLKAFPQLDARSQRLLGVLQEGIPLVPRPYALMGQKSGLTEGEVMERLCHWQSTGLLKRLGVIVRHRAIGYEANAMVVFDVPDQQVRECSDRLLEESSVTLCYLRPRCLPDWPYNLFCMLHGKDQEEVKTKIDALRVQAGLDAYPHAVLFSRKCYKQRGAKYVPDPVPWVSEPHG